MISSLLSGTTSIHDLFYPKLEPFSLFSSDSTTDASGNPVDASGNPTSSGGMFGMGSMFSSSSSSIDASGNPVDASGNPVDASGNPTSSGGMFGMGSMFSSSSSSTDASGNPVDASGNPTSSGGMFGMDNMFSSSSTDASGNTVDASGNPVNTTNPSIAPYLDFFKSLFFLFVQICIIGYLGSSFLTLVRMSGSKPFLDKFMPSDINAYPYCTPSDPKLSGEGAQHVEIDDDSLYSFGFPYNLYCDPGDEDGNTCSKTCGVIKRELKDQNAFFKYTSYDFWIAMSSKHTYATLRAFIKMVVTSLNSIVKQDRSDAYGIVENIVMVIGLIFMYIVGLSGGFVGFFLTYAFQMYNSGFVFFGLAWTFGLFLLSWIPPLLNFFGFIFQFILLFIWIPFTQINEATQSKMVFEIFHKKKTLLMLLFCLGMIMNAFNYLKENEPYYVVVAVVLFLFNMYSSKLA
jgi:hypothetical protein